MDFRATPCAHCRSQAAARTCSSCGGAVCEGCARDPATCPVPRARVLRLGIGRRLRRVDREGRVGLVTAPGRQYHQVFDLASGQWLEAPCRVPALEAPWIPAIAQGGRVIWPHHPEPFPDDSFSCRGVVVGSVQGDATRVLTPARPVIASELGLSPDGRHAWIRTHAETAQVWDLETGEQHEYIPFPASVLQAATLDGARGILASGTYGRVNVLRLDGDEATLLGLLHVRNADTVWIGLSEACMVVVSDLRGREGYTIRAFALDADGVPESEPFHVVPEVVTDPPGERRLQRPLVASLSQDGRYLAVAMRNRDITVHDLQRSRAQHLSGHTDRIAMISFTPDARTLVTSDHDNRVILWPRQDDGDGFLDLGPRPR